MNRIAKGRTGPCLLCFACFFIPTLAPALEGRLLDAAGKPAAGYEVTIVGRPGSVPTDAEGRFQIIPDPVLPFRLVAVGPAGEVSQAIAVTELPAGELEVAIPSAFRDSVTVTSGVAPGIDSPPAAATVILGQEDLEQRRPPRLADALVGVAGASRTDETASAVPVLRGLAQGRTLILLDGARVTAERRAGPSATFLDPFSLGSIEIARGPGSVSYGSDAFGGVINARSRYPEPGNPWLRFEVNGGFGAGNDQSAGLEAAGDVPGGSLLAQLSYRRAEDNAEAGGGDEILDSTYEDRGGALRYLADTRFGRLRAGFSFNEVLDAGKPASDSALNHTIYPAEKSRRLNVMLDTGPVQGWENVEMSLFLGSYRLVLERDRLPATPTATRLIESSDVDANDGSVRIVGARPAFGGRLQLGIETVSRFGLEAVSAQENFNLAGVSTGRVAGVSIEDARQIDQGLFATYQRALAPRVTLSAGLRGDRVEAKNEGGFFGDRSVSDTAASGHAAVTFGPFSNLTTTLQVARGFRAPLLSDRYFLGPSGRGFITGNPDLEPEKSLQYDASVLWGVGHGSVALYGYLYRIDDLVERYRPQRDFFFRNRGEAEIRGVELEAQTPLGAGFHLEIAAALARGEIREDGSAIDNIAAPGGSATLRWAAERGFAYLRTLAYAEDDRPGPTEVFRPGFTTLDAGAGWRLTEELELRLIGRNLSDRRYRDSADEVASLARGRVWSLGLVGRY
jgi:outer membrane receptor protein involved in Fe transport